MTEEHILNIKITNEIVSSEMIHTFKIAWSSQFECVDCS